MDGYGKLGYKILTGYVWAYLHCSDVNYVGKTDDNVEVDMDKLLQVLKEKSYSKHFMGCSLPYRNVRVGRASKAQMMGNWSLTSDEYPAYRYPDFCFGYLYITTPSVGAALVQVGLLLYPQTEVRIIEDAFITGVLREKLNLSQLHII